MLLHQLIPAHQKIGSRGMGAGAPVNDRALSSRDGVAGF